MSTEAKIKRVIRGIIPKGRPFRIAWQPAGVGSYHVLNVITPAWRSLQPSERSRKIEDAFNRSLTARERKHIFFVSVHTAEEYKPLRRSLAAAGASTPPPWARSSNGK